MTTLARALLLAGLAGLALITLASPGATRMWASPWILALGAAALLPALALVLRALDPRTPLVLPPPAWTAAAAAIAAIVLASALASPYRELSLRWSAPLLIGPVLFLAGYDWLHADPAPSPARRDLLLKGLLAAALLVGAVSVGLWLEVIARSGLTRALAGRNAFPLGHSNYTAGLALLALPLAASEFWRRRGPWRGAAALAAALALAMLFSSGSRGGLVGLAVLAAAGLATAPLTVRTRSLLALGALAAGLVFLFANPRTRATFTGGPDRHLVAASAIQRSAMLAAGTHLGADRPLLGWGPGTIPLVYPRYRAELAGGSENVLQLHSTPVHLWAELGLAGLGCLVLLALLAFQARRASPVAALTLAGYAAFALTDWQLDVPVFGAGLAALALLLAPAPAPGALASRTARFTVGAFTIASVTLIALFGRRDPAPALNVQALALAQNPAHADRAVALLRASLALNPDQEIAHFNLGWLLVVREPAAAERHFRAAARLVPDKGGVYFGLGLALLNQGRPAPAARAFALECLNDPAFLVSPWWREPAVDEQRDAAAIALTRYLRHLEGVLPGPAHLPVELLGAVPPGLDRVYRRERTGYPVLMRQLDLPPPRDLFDVREPSTDVPALRGLPAKGWLPAPLLLELLDGAVPAGSSSAVAPRP